MDDLKEECQFCHRNYRSSFLRKHILRKHTSRAAEKRLENSRIKCTICQLKFYFRVDFRKHITSEHPALSIVETEDVFQTKEGNGDCFIRRKARKTRDNSEKCYTLYCQYDWEHLSKIKSSEERKRASRSSGSYKLDGSCPAGIDVRELSNGQVKIKYCRTHIGHGTDFCHFRLPVDERLILEEKIKGNVSFGDILDEIRDSAKKDETRKLDLVNRKTLSNIAAKLGRRRRAATTDCDGDDDDDDDDTAAASLNRWIEKLKKSDCDPFCFYKAVGERYANLKDEDFVLVTTTGVQSAVLNEFTGKVACVDSSAFYYAATNAEKYPLQLTTLLLVDQHRETFPVAFCFSNVVDTYSMKIFFQRVRATIRRPISVSVFMSNDTDLFYKAWIAAMGKEATAVKKLLCPWHADQSWQENLRLIAADVGRDAGSDAGERTCSSSKSSSSSSSSTSQIRKKRASVYKMLRTLLEDADETRFLESLDRTVTDLLADPASRSFGKYFQTEWARRPYAWALCYRKNAVGVNTDTRLENLRRSVKRVYDKGMKISRVRSAVRSLLAIVRNEHFDRIVKYYRTVIPYAIIKINEAHADCHKIEDDDVKLVGNDFVVESGIDESDANSCTVTKMADVRCGGGGGDSGGCDLICRDCDTCAHIYSCTCSEYLIKCNMCVHIHKVIVKYGRLKTTALPLPLPSASTLASAIPDITNRERSKISSLVDIDIDIDNDNDNDVIDDECIAQAAFLENKRLLAKAENVRSLIQTRKLDSSILEKINRNLDSIIRLVSENGNPFEISAAIPADIKKEILG